MNINKPKVRWTNIEKNKLKSKLVSGIEVNEITKYFPTRTLGAIEKMAYRFDFSVKTDKDNVKRFYYGVKRRQVKSCRAIKIRDDEEVTTNNSTSSISLDDCEKQSNESISKSDIKTKSDIDINIEAIQFLKDNKLIANIENIYRASLIIKEGA